MANRSANLKQPILGVEGLRAVLRELPAEIQSTILAEGVKDGAEPIKVASKRYARRSRDTGALEASIDVVVRNYPRNANAVAVIGPARGYYRRGKKVKKGGDFKGADQPANYGHLVEFGHRSAIGGKLRRLDGRGGSKNKKGKEGRFVPAKPFMRPGLLVAQPKVPDAMAKGLERGIEKARAKLVRQYGHKQ